MPPLKGSKRLTDVDTASNNNNNNNTITIPLSGNLQTDNGQYYTSRYYAPKVLSNLSSLRRNSRFCDIEIIAGGKVVKVHKFF